MKVREVLTTQRVADFWNVLREVDPQQVIREADQPVRLVVCGVAGVGKRALAAVLSAGAAETDPLSGVAIDVCDMAWDVPTALPAADLFVYVTAADEEFGPVQRGQLAQLRRRSSRVVCVVNTRGRTGNNAAIPSPADADEVRGLRPDRICRTVLHDREAVQRDLMPGVIRAVPHLALALGRHLPAARDAASSYLIADTARVNTEFVLISGLPSFVPLVGPLASVGTDLVVLTKNQIMLLLKLALIHRRPIDNRLQVLTEIAPVIGAAFVWRSVARSLSAAAPGPLGVAPRGAVAYVGTYVAGRAGQYYYRRGQRPSAEVLDAFRDEAVRQLTGLTPRLAQIGRYLGFS